MSPEDRYAAEVIVRELERRKQRNKIDTFYPTSENRAGYPVHMAFFEAGKKYRERLALAANRCISPWTEIRTAAGSRLCEEFLGEPSFDVQSWDGDFRCVQAASGLFLKGVEPQFRVFLDNGEFFDCTRKHRVLTNAGFLSFDQLIRASSGLHLSQKLPGYSDGYDKEHYPYGSQPLFCQDSALAQFPSLGDARQRDPYSLQMDAAAHKHQYIHVSQGGVHLPILDDPQQIADLCAKFENPLNGIDVLWPNGLRQECLQFLAEFFLAQEEFQPASRQLLADRLLQMVKLYFDGANKPELGNTSIGNASQFQGSFFHRKSLQEFGHDIEDTWIFFPLETPKLIGDQKVMYIMPIGYQPVLDFTVDKTANYLTGGVVNSNTGKTEGMGGYETSLHLTGRYPDWWVGRRFDKPVNAWIGGDTATTVRDIIQNKLLGNTGEYGTGLIPGDLLIDTTNKRGVPDAVENVYVKHISGGRSVAQLKSYDQGREAWQGTEKSVIWLDEEPPMTIYSESLMRTMTTNGIVLNTYTPMNGMTDVTESFLAVDKPGSKFVCTATWDDCLHLDSATKLELWNSIPIHERDARSKGIPSIGPGKIYPVSLESLLVDPFELPKHWTKGYALDVGWNKTAALWGAYDRESDTLYLYSEHYQGLAEPAVHASAIKARGEMTGYIDPAAQGGSQADGEKLIQLYRNEGLKLALADNAKEAGIFDVYQRMTTGRLKIFTTLTNLQKELPLYHRDSNGAIVKRNDHLCDCFHGDTLVVTDKGEVKIRDLVGTTGNVLSSDGQFHEFSDCKIYRANCELITLTFNDGRTVTCTPDHLFLTSEKQWKPACEMLNMQSFSVTNPQLRFIPKSSRNLTGKFTGFVGSIFSGMGNVCTALFGHTSMAKYLKGMLSITRTTIRKITTYPTLSLWKTPGICHITQQDGQTKEFTPQSKQPKHGINPKTGKDGIATITKWLRMQCIEKFYEIAISAERIMKPSQSVLANSVQITANLPPVENQASIPSLRVALFAEMASARTNIQQQSLAGQVVKASAGPLTVVKIETAKNGDAYCLTVDETGEFAISGGVIVHNCLRYLIRAIPVLTYAGEKIGHYDYTHSGIQYRTSRPNRRNKGYGD